jgi:hypothetical protein
MKFVILIPTAWVFMKFVILIATGWVFMKFRYFNSLKNSVENIQVPLKSDKNGGYFT